MFKNKILIHRNFNSQIHATFLTHNFPCVLRLTRTITLQNNKFPFCLNLLNQNLCKYISVRRNVSYSARSGGKISLLIQGRYLAQHYMLCANQGGQSEGTGFSIQVQKPTEQTICLAPTNLSENIFFCFLFSPEIYSIKTEKVTP